MVSEGRRQMTRSARRWRHVVARLSREDGLLAGAVAVSSRTWLLLGALTLAAAVVRLVWSAWTAPELSPFSDAEYYNATALSLARGLGYTVGLDEIRGFYPGGDPSAFWPPGYPAYLAGWYRLFGESLAVGRTANIVAGALTVVPVYWIGRRLFSPRAGIIGAGITALLPSLVLWTPVLLSHALFVLLFSSAMAVFLYGPDRSGALRRMPVAAAAVLTCGATLVRGQALLLVPLAGVYWIAAGTKPRTALTWTALVLAGVVVLVAPWTVRNMITMGEPIVLSANFGYNLRIGHAPYSTGRYIVPDDLWAAEPGLTFQEREGLFNRLGTRRAIDYAAGNPGAELELSGRKIMWLWRPDSDVLPWVTAFGEDPLPNGAWEPLRLLLDTTYFIVLALAACVLVRVRQLWRSLLFPLLLIGVWTALHVVFFGEPRYHLPLLVVLIPMAGATVDWAMESVAVRLGRGAGRHSRAI